MLIAALAYLVIQPAATAVVWEQPPAAIEASSGASGEATPERPATTLPDWALADPFGYERARCNPMVRGAKTLEACQAETRIALATALGDDLPDALRPPGMAGDCQMIQAAGGGSAYALQCGSQSRSASTSTVPQEMDCRPRPERGGFSSECRPLHQEEKGLKLRLWGGDDD